MFGICDENSMSSEAKIFRDVRSFNSSSEVNDIGFPLTILLFILWVNQALERLKNRSEIAAQLMKLRMPAPSMFRIETRTFIKAVLGCKYNKQWLIIQVFSYYFFLYFPLVPLF